MGPAMPIVNYLAGDFGNVIVREGCGVLCEAENALALGSVLECLTTDDRTRIQMSARSSGLAMRFAYSASVGIGNSPQAN